MDQPINGFDLIALLSRDISLKEVRVDIILEGVVGVQEYKNSVKQTWDIFKLWPRVDRIIVLLKAPTAPSRILSTLTSFTDMPLNYLSK